MGHSFFYGEEISQKAIGSRNDLGGNGVLLEDEYGDPPVPIKFRRGYETAGITAGVTPSSDVAYVSTGDGVAVIPIPPDDLSLKYWRQD